MYLRCPTVMNLAGMYGFFSDSDVFLSYKREPESMQCADEIEEYLANLNVKVYRDTSRVVGGDSFPKKLAAAIDRTTIFIPILSNDYMGESGESWCHNELNFAKEKKKQIIPVILKGAKIPNHIHLSIGTLQRVTYDPKNPSPGLRSMATAVQRKLHEVAQVCIHYICTCIHFIIHPNFLL